MKAIFLAFFLLIRFSLYSRLFRVASIPAATAQALTTNLSFQSVPTAKTTTMMQATTANKNSNSRRHRRPWRVYPASQYDALVRKHGSDGVKLVCFVRHAEGTHNVNKEYKSPDQLDARLTPFGGDQCRKLRNELLHYYYNFHQGGDDDDDDNGKDCGSEKEATKTPRGGIFVAENDRRIGLELLFGGTENSPLEEDRKDGDETNEEHNNKDNDVCVVTSPMTRCVQTSLISFDFLLEEEATTSTDSSEKNARSSSNNAASTSSSSVVPFLAFEGLRETVNYNCDRRRSISDIAREFPMIDFSHCEHDQDEIWNSYRRREETEKVDKENNNSHYGESAQLFVVAERGRQSLEFLQSLPQRKLIVCTHSAYLRCILNWGQGMGVPKAYDQWLDDRDDPTVQDKLFEYSSCGEGKDDDDVSAFFEQYMRSDYENAELRSFCLLVNNDR